MLVLKVRMWLGDTVQAYRKALGRIIFPVKKNNYFYVQVFHVFYIDVTFPLSANCKYIFL